MKTGKIESKKIIHNTYLLKFQDREIIATKSRYPPHYGERKFGEYREWIPSRSKLASVLLSYKLEINPEWKCLYLGAASGTTVSHLSDILDKGIIYAVEYSAKPFMKLLELAEERRNVIPLLKDASKSEEYAGIVEPVDFIYQDVSQKNQVEIFLKNVEFFLKKGGDALIMVKAKSIDSTVDSEEIYKKVLEEISDKLKVMYYGRLKHHKDHIFIHCLK
jgi:fibrillarin-like pre-rRNA processing protein